MSDPLYSDTLVQNLEQTRPWVRFLAVLGTIGVGFLVLAGILSPFAGRYWEEYLGFGFPGVLVGALYIVLAAAALYPVLKLHQYAGKLRDFVATRSAEDLEAALEKQKIYWRASGILAIVTVGLSLLGGIAVAVYTAVTLLRDLA